MFILNILHFYVFFDLFLQWKLAFTKQLRFLIEEKTLTSGRLQWGTGDPVSAFVIFSGIKAAIITQDFYQLSKRCFVSGFLHTQKLKFLCIQMKLKKCMIVDDWCQMLNCTNFFVRRLFADSSFQTKFVFLECTWCARFKKNKRNIVIFFSNFFYLLGLCEFKKNEKLLHLVFKFFFLKESFIIIVFCI